MAQRIEFTTPVGRLVGGSLYDPETKDQRGQPLMNATKTAPRVDFQIGVAFPKTQAGHWANESWMAQFWQLANAAFPNGEAQHPSFAFKITDGDSTIPNKSGRKPCDREGYPGNWVIWFGGGFQPRIYNHDGSQQILEKDAVVPGDYIQVFGSSSDNKPSETPGLYMNHSMISLQGKGQRISSGPDVSQAGFGQGVVLPAGASAPGMPPPGGGFNPAPPAAYAPPGPPVGAPPAFAPPAAYAPPAAAAPPPVTYAPPNYAAITPGPPVGAPPAFAPPAAYAPPAAPARVMLPAAGGFTYEQMIANGWTDATLVQNGMMQG